MSNSDQNINGAQSLKRFLTKVVIFFLLLIAATFMIDRFLTESLKRYPVGETGVWNEIFAGRVNSEIVIYGASRALVHFDTHIMEKGLETTVYNLGINGHNFWLQYLRHSILLKYNTKPKLIVLEISTNTLEKRNDLFDPDQFIPYMLNHSEIATAISSYEGYTYLDFHVPLIRYFGKAESLVRALLQFLSPTYYKPDRFKGYLGVDLTWSEGLERSKHFEKTSKVVLHPESVRLLNSFLEECKALDIDVIFVSTPMFTHEKHDIAYRSETMAYFESISKKYGLQYLDYSNDPISYNTQYFYNAAHMNKKGAELFTRKFVEDMKSLPSVGSDVNN